MIPFNKVKPSTLKSISTGIENLDKFLSLDGGIPLGQVLLLSGSAGSGKTSLTTIIQRNILQKTAMLQREVSSEMLAKQMKNIDTSKNDNCYIDDKMSIQEFLQYTAKNDFKLVVTDSLQRIRADVGNLSEKAADEEIYSLLRAWATRNHSTVILIAQNTKDNNYAGSSGLKFNVDAHFELFFDFKNNKRFIQCSKNRSADIGTLFYRFTNTEEIMEFSYEGFENENKYLDSHLSSVIEQYVQSLKRLTNLSIKKFAKSLTKLLMITPSQII